MATKKGKVKRGRATPARVDPDSLIEYIGQNISTWRAKKPNAWELLTDVIYELCENTSIGFGSQAIVAAVLTEAFKRVRTGKIEATGDAIESQIGASIAARELGEVVRAIQDGTPIPQSILIHYGYRLSDAETEKRLEALRAQLEALGHEPENEAARFKVEAEIYNLEHPKEADDEWPEIIAA